MTDFNKRTEEKITDLENELDSLKARMDRHYEAGWNSALEMAAFNIEHGFSKAFGKDTLSSIAIFIREMKK